MSVRKTKPAMINETDEEIAWEAQTFLAERALVSDALRERRELAWGMNIAPTYRGFAVVVECRDITEHLVPNGVHAALIPFYDVSVAEEAHEDTSREEREYE